MLHNNLPNRYLNLLEMKEFDLFFFNNFKIIKKEINNIGNEFIRIKNIFPIDKVKKPNIVNDNLKFVEENQKEFFNKNNFQRKDDLAVNDVNKNKDKYIHFRHYDNGLIEIFNLMPYDIEISDIIHNDSSHLNANIILKSYLSDPSPLQINTNIFGYQDGNITVISKLNGFFKASNNEFSLTTSNIKNPLISNNKNENFIKINNEFIPINKKIKIYSPIIINGNVRIPKGSHIEFDKDAYLIVNGTLLILGTENQPVTLKGINQFWRGIYNYNSINESKIVNAKNSPIPSALGAIPLHVLPSMTMKALPRVICTQEKIKMKPSILITSIHSLKSMLIMPKDQR